MQAFFAKASAGAEAWGATEDVEVDRCEGCGGIWFDWGELAQVLGKPLQPELLEGETSRRCAYCRISMLPAVLPGGVPVETCSACRGIYLDAGELRELGGEEPDPPEPEPAAPVAEALSAFNSFACVKCGKRFPVAKGNAIRGGLACAECTPRAGPHPKELRETSSLLDLFFEDPDWNK
jgi:Zn-finger nucleic acid-binding protein